MRVLSFTCTLETIADPVGALSEIEQFLKNPEKFFPESLAFYERVGGDWKIDSKPLSVSEYIAVSDSTANRITSEPNDIIAKILTGTVPLYFAATKIHCVNSAVYQLVEAMMDGVLVLCSEVKPDNRLYDMLKNYVYPFYLKAMD